jgi:AcrR family transcriptional regulator
MDLADAEGLDAVTIRRLAQELGVTPMALYWHFSDKDALLTAVSARLWDDAAAILDAGDEADGWDEMRRITSALVEALRAHPGCAALAPLAVLAGPSGLDLTEKALGLLFDLGVEGEQAAELAHFLLSTVVTLVDSRPGGELGQEDADEHLRQKRLALASLPPDRYPRVTAIAGFLVDCPDTDGYFAHGVDFVVGGVRQQVETARR